MPPPPPHEKAVLRPPPPRIERVGGINNEEQSSGDPKHPTSSLHKECQIVALSRISLGVRPIYFRGSVWFRTQDCFVECEAIHGIHGSQTRTHHLESYLTKGYFNTPLTEEGEAFWTSLNLENRFSSKLKSKLSAAKQSRQNWSTGNQCSQMRLLR